MRHIAIILLVLAQAAFSFETSEDYSACIDTSNLSSVSIWTYPANGSYRIDRYDTIMLAVPKYNNADPPEGFFEDGGACVRWYGNTFWLEDSVSGPSPSDLWWYEIVEAAVVDYDTIAVCKTELDSAVWATWASDTILDDDWPSYGTTFRNISCDVGECDTCALIIYWDSTQVRKDTLKLAYLREYSPFTLVEWFFRVSVNDSNYYDTLIYVTEGDTNFYANRTPFTVSGTGTSGTAAITGWRSAGMDVYAGGARVVSAVDSLEVGLSHLPFSFNWTGLRASVVESLQVWGISDIGLSSDTTTLKRRYVNLNEGQFNRR